MSYNFVNLCVVVECTGMKFSSMQSRWICCQFSAIYNILPLQCSAIYLLPVYYGGSSALWNILPVHQCTSVPVYQCTRATLGQTRPQQMSSLSAKSAQSTVSTVNNLQSLPSIRNQLQSQIALTFSNYLRKLLTQKLRKTLWNFSILPTI